MAAVAYLVRFAWTANTETDLAGYRLYEGRETGKYTQTQEMGSGVTGSFSGAVGPHVFALTALNTGGQESEHSNELAYAIPALTLAVN